MGHSTTAIRSPPLWRAGFAIRDDPASGCSARRGVLPQWGGMPQVIGRDGNTNTSGLWDFLVRDGAVLQELAIEGLAVESEDAGG